MRPPITQKRGSFKDHPVIITCLFLSLITLSLFWQVHTHDFINLDDISFIVENPHIRAGFNLKSIIWAFTTTHPDYWHPLTWLSHMLDYQLYGLNPGGYHFNNVLFHLANTLLLFLCLNRMTGALLRSAFVAALFATHPLHVESVAWVVERKDVLSTLFWVLSIGSYIYYVERPSIGRYLPVFLFFSFGLMSKPMVVTLPFTLLLLDYWPLQRFKSSEDLYINNRKKDPDTGKEKKGPSFDFRIIWDKIPLFVLTALSSSVTFFSTQETDTMVSLNTLPLKFRIGNAVVSYAGYIKKMLWPQDLAVFYPHLGHGLSLWQVMGFGFLLMAVTVWCIRSAQSKPYLPVGWFWYLGTLIPVIGVIQVGALSMADRFTYMPLIGLFIILAWGIPELFKKWHFKEPVFKMFIGFVLAICIVLTHFQLKYWKNSTLLFEHAIEVNADNYLAHYNLGLASSQKKDFKKAIRHFEKALSLRPGYMKAHNGLGIALAREGRLSEAVGHHLKALGLNPNNPDFHNNLGVTLVKQKNYESAIEHYSKAIQLRPDYISARMNLGFLFSTLKRFMEAETQFRNVLKIQPDHPKALFYLGLTFRLMGNHEAVVKIYRRLHSIDPNLAEALSRKNKD